MVKNTPEQVLPCLKNFVEDVDNGQIAFHTPRVLSKYCLETTGAETIHTFLHCDVVACTADATVVEDNGSSAVRYASFHWRDEPCVREEIVANDTLPHQADKRSCVATAISYALSRSDSEYSAATIDAWLGRQEGEYPTNEGLTNLNLELLRHGYSLEIVKQTGTVDIREYYKEGSKLGYEDYKKAILEFRNWQSTREFFETFTEQQFNEYMLVLRRMTELFVPYEANGQLTYTWADVDSAYINERLKQWSIVAITNWFDGTTDLAHAVVVEDVEEVAGGWVVARYFDPGFEKPSRMTKHRGENISDIFELDNGLTLLRRYIF